MRRSGAGALVVLALSASLAGAQQPLRFSASVGATILRATTELRGASEAQDGPGFEIAAVATRGVWRFAGRVTRGTLSADGSGERTATDLEAVAAYAPLSWIALGTGVRLRRASTAADSRRVFAWEARARLDVPLLAPHTAVYAEVWHSIAGSTAAADDFAWQRGGEAGFTVRLPRLPLYARLAYRIDRATAESPRLDDTLEQFVLAGGLTLP